MTSVYLFLLEDTVTGESINALVMRVLVYLRFTDDEGYIKGLGFFGGA